MSDVACRWNLGGLGRVRQLLKKNLDAAFALHWTSTIKPWMDNADTRHIMRWRNNSVYACSGHGTCTAAGCECETEFYNGTFCSHQIKSAIDDPEDNFA